MSFSSRSEQPTRVPIEVLWDVVLPIHPGAYRLCGALFRPWITADPTGHWWRLFTMNFVHMGALHLLANCHAAVVYTNMFAKMEIPALFLTTVLCGSALLTAAFGLAEKRILVGLSGVTHGLCATLLVSIFCPRHLIERKERLCQACILLVDFVIINILAVWLPISWLAHLGGASAGALLGLAIDKDPTTGWKVEGLMSESLKVILVTGLVIMGAVLFPDLCEVWMFCLAVLSFMYAFATLWIRWRREQAMQRRRLEEEARERTRAKEQTEQLEQLEQLEQERTQVNEQREQLEQLERELTRANEQRDFLEREQLKCQQLEQSLRQLSWDRDEVQATGDIEAEVHSCTSADTSVGTACWPSCA